MSDIFLSYATADRARIRPLVEALEGSGWSVWWDRRIPAGRTYAQVIEAAIRDARCMLVVWTKTSVESEWVREEADRGKRHGLLVPVRMDDVEPPLGFGQIQAADLIGWDGARSAPGFRQLVEDVASILGPERRTGDGTARAERPPPATAPPPEAFSAEAPRSPPAAAAGTGARQPETPSPRPARTRRWIGAIAVGLAVLGMGAYWFLEHQAEQTRLETAQRERERLEALRAQAEREGRLAEERRQAEEKQRLDALRAREEQDARLAEDRRRAEEKQRLETIKQRELQEAKLAEDRRRAEEKQRLETIKQRELQEARLAEDRRRAEEKQRLETIKQRELQEAKLAEDRRRAEEAARQQTAPRAPARSIGGIEQQRRLAAEIGWPDRVRCFGYDPAGLRVGHGPDRDWSVLTADNFQLARAETPAEADAVLQIARAHAAQCMIGLDRRAPGGRQWVFVFWAQGTAPTLPGEGCHHYDPGRLQIRDDGPTGWALVTFDPQMGGYRPLHMLNDMADAQVALAYARRHSALCFLGQFSRNQEAYLVRYWKR
jgi:hypothetical protein